ncbi:MAG: PQQ-binding-like beta-propeller repeat protein [Verrucomicrobiales bacterium]
MRLFLCLISLLAPLHADWTEFRGPLGNGHLPASSDSPQSYPTTWSEEQNIVWKTPVPGRAWSSPVVADEEIWLTNATPDGKKMSALCLDFKTGRIRHERLLFENESPEELGNHVNGYGSPTPTIDDERVYLHFGSYGTAALDRQSAEVLWERRDLPCQHFRGPGSSPILHKNLLILTMDGIDVQYLVALDKKTGQTVWRTPRSTDFGDVEADGKIRGDGDFRKSYSTPIIFPHDGREVLLSAGAKAAIAYDANSGEELWHLTYNEFSTSSRPLLLRPDFALISTGFGKSHLLGIRLTPGMRGDVTATAIAWDTFRRMPSRVSPIAVGSELYTVNEKGILSKINSASGEIDWFTSLGGPFSASPVSADGHLYFADENGKTSVVRPGKKDDIISVNQLDEGCMASPALHRGSLLLRTKSHLYRIAEQP